MPDMILPVISGWRAKHELVPPGSCVLMFVTLSPVRRIPATARMMLYVLLL